MEFSICQCPGFAVKLRGHTLHGVQQCSHYIKFLDFAQASMWGAVDVMPASKAREIVQTGSLIDFMSILQIHIVYHSIQMSSN